MYQNMDYDGWSMEMYDIAITLYDGINENEALPQWYIDENLPMVEEKVTLGMYRLAYLLSQIYSNNEAFLQ